MCNTIILACERWGKTLITEDVLCRVQDLFCMWLKDCLLKNGTEKLLCCNKFSLHSLREAKNACARTRSRLVLSCAVLKILQTGDFIPC